MALKDWFKQKFEEFVFPFKQATKETIEFWKEEPEAAKVAEFPIDLVREIFTKPVARGVLEIGKRVSPTFPEKWQPAESGKLTRVLFGKEPIEAWSTTAERIRQWGERKTGINIPKWTAIPIAVGLGLLDLPPGGLFKGEGKISQEMIEQLAKETNEKAIKKILSGTLPNEVIEEIAPKIAKTTKAEDIVQTIIGGVQKKASELALSPDEYIRQFRKGLFKEAPQEIQEATIKSVAKEVPPQQVAQVGWESLKPPKINLDKIVAPEEIKQSISQWVEENAPRLVDKFPRYTFKEIEETLQKSGLDPDQALKALNQTFGGDTKKILTALYGVRRYAVNVEQEISQTMKMLKEATDPGQIADLQLKLLELTHTRNALWESIAGSGRVAGQYLAFRKMIARALEGTPEAKKMAITRILGKRFAPDGPLYKEFITLLKNIDVENPQAVIKFLSRANVATAPDVLMHIWYNSVLSGPKIQLVNTLGDALFGTVEAGVIKPMSFLLDVPIKKLTGREAEIATRPSLIGYYGGLVRGFRAGLDRMMYVLKTGVDPEELIAPSKWATIKTSPLLADYFRLPLVGVKKVPSKAKGALSAADTIISIPTRLMKAVDAFFNGMFTEARKFELAIPKIYSKDITLRELFSRAEDVIASDPDIISKAIKYGRYMTFSEEPGRLTQKIMELREIIPGGRYLVPFVNIASNLWKRGIIEYTPAGIKGVISSIKIKDPEAAEKLARAIVGSGLITAGMFAWKSGRLTLAPPKDPAERDAFYRRGEVPYSVKIGNYQIGIRRLEPFIYPFLIGAIIAQKIEEGRLSGQQASEIMANTAQELGRLMMNASYLQTIGDLYEGIFGYGDPGISGRVLKNIGKGFIPYSGLLRSIATALDPEVKDYLLTWKEDIQSMIPGLREKVPGRVTVFGEESKYATGRSGVFAPITVSRPQASIVDMELKRLDWYPDFPQKEIWGKELTHQQWRIYTKISGRIGYLAMERIIQTPGYQKLSDNEKREVLQRIMQEARSLTRTMFFGVFQYYQIFYDEFRNAGFNRADSEFMADKAFERLLERLLTK